MKMNRKSKYLGQAAQGNAERATGEAQSDDELIADGREDQVKGDLKHEVERIKDAFRY